MSSVAIYKDTFSKQYKVTSYMEAIQMILTGDCFGIDLKEAVSYLRTLGKHEYNIEKRKLPCVTWSGVCQKGTRSIETMDFYNGLVILDVDGTIEDNIRLTIEMAKDEPHVMMIFRSPSGNGMKILVKVDTDKDEHRHAFLHLQHHIESVLPVKIDKSGKDCSRLCYMTYDPHAYVNLDAKVFSVDKMYGQINTAEAINADIMRNVPDLEAKFKTAVKWIEKHYTYHEGERNVFIHALACAMNRLGVNIDHCITMIDNNYVTPDRIWINSVRGAYFRNAHEFGTVELRSAMVINFDARAYLYDNNYSDNEAVDKVMRIAGVMSAHNIDSGTIIENTKLLMNHFTNMGTFNFNYMSPNALVADAMRKLSEAQSRNAEHLKLAYQTPAEMAADIINIDLGNGIMTYIPPIDENTGGMHKGNLYGLIGFAETMKSIFAEYVAYKNAMAGIPVLILNGEMSKMQSLERLSIRAMGTSVRMAMKTNELNRETIEDFSRQLMEATNNNLFVFSGLNYNKASILATCDHIYHKFGKKVELIVMDGISQMDQLGKEEAPANIHNSMIAKEIVKEANNGEGVAMLMLCHCSGRENKLIRNTGTVVRGGSKLIANMDGYFSTSLFIDPEAINEDNPDDINYLEGKFCLRFNDKRGGTGVHYAVCNVAANLAVEYEPTDYRQYEVKS